MIQSRRLDGAWHHPPSQPVEPVGPVSGALPLSRGRADTTGGVMTLEEHLRNLDCDEDCPYRNGGEAADCDCLRGRLIDEYAALLASYIAAKDALREIREIAEGES